MPSWTSLFCCSSQDRLSSKLEAETRHARIVAVTADGSSSSPHRPQRYTDGPPGYTESAQHPLITIDEKAPIDFEGLVDGEDEGLPPISPRSSVVSIPSTRLTDLTSMRTGDTMHTGARASLEWPSLGGSRPPSYYAYARSPSPAYSVAGSDGERDSLWQHPVMASNWLEVLQQDTLREAARGQVHGGQNGNGARTTGLG